MMHMHTCIHAQMHTFCFLALLSAVVLLTMKNAPSPPRQLRVQKIQKAQIQQQVASSPDCDCGDAPLIDGINALNIFSLAGVEHKLKEHKMNFEKETPHKTQYMKFFKQVNKQAKSYG